MSDARARVWRAMVLRSGLLTAITLAILLGGMIIIVKERGKGHLAQLERQLHPKTVAQASTMPPLGGQDPIVLERAAVAGGSATTPEFLSATLLPGRGMNILQIMASVPSLGRIPLLDSPSLDEASKLLDGTGADALGFQSLNVGAALEAPWANRMGGVSTPDGGSVMAVWDGQTFVLPAAPQPGDGAATAIGGLLFKRQANSVETHVVPDGWQSRVIYDAGGFDGRWLSQTEVTTLVLLNGRVLEIAVTAKNTGAVPEPIGIGWRPRFAIPGGDRADTVLRLPEALKIEMRDPAATVRGGLPTGQLLPLAGRELEFTKPVEQNWEQSLSTRASYT